MAESIPLILSSVPDTETGSAMTVKLRHRLRTIRKSEEMPQESVRFLEKSMNWIFPGCQLFYRDTDADIDVQKSYPFGHVIRAGFFVDVTVKAQRPKTRFRFIIGSAHCAKLYEAVPYDADLARWRLCTLHFNSYFKVMDIYEKNGVTQIFLLHIPYLAVPVFKSEHSFNFIQGMTETNLVEIVRRSLDEKLQMDVFADTTEEELLERMKQPVGLDNSGNPVPMGYMPIPGSIKA